MVKLPAKQANESVRDYYSRVITSKQYAQLSDAGWAVISPAKAASLAAQIVPQPKWRIYVRSAALPCEELVTKFLHHKDYPQWAAERVSELHSYTSTANDDEVNAYLTVRLADAIKILLVTANEHNAVGKKNLFPEDVGKRYYAGLQDYLAPREWELIKGTRT